MSAFVKRLVRTMAVLVVILGSATANAADLAGVVLMAAGEVVSVAADGSRRTLEDGSKLNVGDTVKTGSGATLQVKLSDDGLLVISANSSVRIDAYDYNPNDPANQAARITLLEGRMRSVTGKLGESNHDAFRLNTPIAAIGIRGTDFETLTASEVTRVRLNSGAIVLSPLGAGCEMSGLGPCGTTNSLLLTENLESTMAEFRAGDPAPRLISKAEYRAETASITDDGVVEEEGRVEQREVTGILVAEGPTVPVEPTVPDEPITPEPEIVPEPEPEDLLPDDWVDEIHWGHWADTPIEGTPSLADLDADSTQTLFTNDVFVLVRNEGFLRLGNDRVSFMLLEAKAVIFGDGSLDDVPVTDGSLAIDFADREFGTALSVDSPRTGARDLSASGSVDGQGLFRSDSGNMRVFGAVSGSLDQAGYLFRHGLGDGLSIQGATQWLAE